ncbi:hypothetical protein BOTBODRAFT_170229 [Botryobasidium botryosum FD-172 SS1]|uniref:MYND-type domain-containing protein n=1 Tax=Botryobasidium botryosum (strain FD-172 SS1) TaxID=930990 RepID=A0A067N8X7_BOTB1|nr:hypothetical protein BOTBODRAFT_170229 [Botryobasidium botryosum FD-172 SS1]
MPGPRKHKSKAKKRPSHGAPYAPPAGFMENIYVAEGWYAIANLICETLGLPDLNTRNGLKRVHKEFADISQRLDKVYTFAIKEGNDKIAGGVVGIYTKMCADSILRNNLFKDAGLLSKVFPLLEKPACVYVALQALCSITHMGGREVRLAIAKETPTLLRLLESQPDDVQGAELTITVLSHTVATVVCNEEPPEPDFLRLINMPRLLSAFLFHLHKPTASTLLINHALDLIAGASQHCAKDFRANPSAINLLVAAMRSPDIQTRSLGLSGIMRLQINIAQKDDTNHDPKKMLESIQRGFPANLNDALMSYGPARSDVYLILYASRDFQQAMFKCAQDHDLYSLGLKLADIILTTEYSIVQGAFQVQDPRTGELKFDNVGLPFTMWHESLPLCADAIRARGNPAEEDKADIVELKFLIMQSRMTEAHAIATRSVERSPKVGFFYYVLTLGAEKSVGLRIAKKGLKCPNLSSYVRFGLLYRAAEHAAELGLGKLQEAALGGGQSWDEGVAFIMSAWEDTKTFVEEASPDTRSMKSALYWHTALSLVVKGDKIQPDLREVQDAITKLDLVDDFARFFQRPISQTQMRLVHKLIVERMARAWEEWGDVITHFSNDEEVVSPKKAEDDLANWLEKLDVGDDGHDHHQPHKTHPKINVNDVELYRCSWCKNPSAVLRKCSGCEKTRYCDPACQREHWTGGHKKMCKRAT